MILYLSRKNYQKIQTIPDNALVIMNYSINMKLTCFKTKKKKLFVNVQGLMYKGKGL